MPLSSSLRLPDQTSVGAKVFVLFFLNQLRARPTGLAQVCVGTASAGAPSGAGGDWFEQSPEPPAGPGPGRALVPAHLSSHHSPQLPGGIGRGAGVRAFSACLRLLVQTTSTKH